MKTITSNKSGEALEVAKRIMYSLQVLLVGLFIPFSFVFGISYNMPNTKAESSISMSKQNPVSHQDNTVDLTKVLSEKNS
ncbi:MAG TPA: hypothetical protein VLS85_12705 [Hanamia sp.]|nr:hypothetical protein [Hanamia sp.]